MCCTANNIIVILSNLKDLSITAAAITGIIISIKGLHTWRKQLVGNVEYKISSKLLSALYKTRSAIRHVRSPMMFASEYPEKTPSDIIKLSKFTSYEDTAYAYSNRWKKINKALTLLHDAEDEAEVIWDEKIKNLIKPIYSQIADLNVTLQQHLEKIAKSEKKNHEYKHEDYKKSSNIIYDSSNYATGKLDEFAKKVFENINEIKTFLKPYLKK